MNKRLAPLILAAFIMDGCAFFRNPTVISIAASIAETATTYGVSNDLQNHPKNRPAYEASLQALNLLLLSEKYDPASLKSALANLPIKELKGTQGALIISGVVNVFQLAIRPGDTNSVLYEINSEAAVAAVGKAIRDGIQTALLMNPPPAAGAVAAPRAAPPTPALDYRISPTKNRRI